MLLSRTLSKNVVPSGAPYTWKDPAQTGTKQKACCSCQTTLDFFFEYPSSLSVLTLPLAWFKISGTAWFVPSSDRNPVSWTSFLSCGTQTGLNYVLETFRKGNKVIEIWLKKCNLLEPFRTLFCSKGTTRGNLSCKQTWEHCSEKNLKWVLLAQ